MVELHWAYPAKDCHCPKEPCGGVNLRNVQADCPDHTPDMSGIFHRANKCPGKKEPEDLG